jgi:hypothetical protein
MFTLAECEAKWGKVASAVAHYSDYLGLASHMTAEQQARHQGRKQTASAQVQKLSASVPHLTLVLPRGAHRDTVIQRDGVVLQQASLGIALPIDPGEHVIVTQVPGGAEHKQVIAIELKDNKQIVLEVDASQSHGAPASVTAPSATKAAASSGPTPKYAAPAPPAERADIGGTYRTWAYVAGGVGAAGIVVGSVTGLMSMSNKKTVDDNCDGQECNASGMEAADRGTMLGNVSTVGFGVGIAGVATGIVLWLAAPRAKTSETGQRRWQPVVASQGKDGTLLGLRGMWWSRCPRETACWSRWSLAA